MFKKIFKIFVVILVLFIAIYNSLFYIQTPLVDMTQYSPDGAYRLEFYRPLTVSIKARIIPFYKDNDHEIRIKLLDKNGKELHDVYDYFMENFFNTETGGNIQWKTDEVRFRIANSKGEMEIVEWKLR